MVRYSVQVDGRDIVTEFSARSPGNALSGARARYNKVIKSRYENITDADIDETFGRPVRDDAAAQHYRNVTGANINPDLPTDLQNLGISDAIDESFLDAEEETAIRKQEINNSPEKTNLMIKATKINNMKMMKMIV